MAKRNNLSAIERVVASYAAWPHCVFSIIMIHLCLVWKYAFLREKIRVSCHA